MKSTKLLSLFSSLIFLFTYFSLSGQDSFSSKTENEQASSSQKIAAVLVGNNKGGTVSVIDAKKLEVISEIDCKPDWEEYAKKAVSEENKYLNAKLGIKYVDDLDVMPDGKTLLVSRPVFNDIAAFDILSQELLWKVDLGMRPDHQVMSEDGKFLFVSMLANSQGLKVDLEKREVVGSYPTGQGPHSIVLDHGENWLYSASLVDPLIMIVNPKTLEIKDTLRFSAGVRPFKITDDNKRIITQLSYYSGLVEYDIAEKKVIRKVQLPIPEHVKNMPKSDYPFMAAHHGISISPDRKFISSVGTVSDYVAILSYPELKLLKTFETGIQPSWATNGFDGDSFFVSARGNDKVYVFSYSKQELIKEIKVGKYPQRMARAMIQMEEENLARGDQ
ncbi:MAG: hypothetical protein AAF696_10725 [Bacteroidota bacterium]